MKCFFCQCEIVGPAVKPRFIVDEYTWSHETHAACYLALKLDRDRLRKALEEIAKGEGRFSRDPLTHANNTVQDMKAIALAALNPEAKP